MLDKKKINNIIAEINKIKEYTIVEITKKHGNGEIEKHNYQAIFDNEFEDYELISIQEKNTIWGFGGSSIEELQKELLKDFIYDHYEDIKIID